MKGFHTIVRGAPALALAATLLASALGPPSSVRADPAAGPAGRLQVVIKKIHIYDDRDGRFSGKGEMTFDARLHPVQDKYDRNSSIVASMTYAFSAGSGEDVFLERVVPQAGDIMADGASPEAGMPVHAGQRYMFVASMQEIDNILGGANDQMGKVLAPVDEERGWAIGTHTVRSVRDNGDPGDYDVTFEIRRAPLPDLQPVNIQVDDRFGSAEKRVCMGVLNREVGHAGPFEVALRVDGVVPPGGGYSVGGLAPEEHVWACVEVELPTSGQHVLAAVVDERRARIEFNETNNVYTQSYVVAQPTPAPALPDLTISAIRINGHVPDGKDDCKDGKNDVAVVVKNAGTANAGSLVVRLDVDGDEREQASVPGLDAGQEHEVRFDDVRLKKGERTLLAIADPKQVVAESKEDNNELKITARCKDDD